MAIEIERKFLVVNPDWKLESGKGVIIKQGYLVSEKDRVVRIRVKGGKGILTIKGSTVGMTRSEFEYEIPLNEAKQLLEMCGQDIIEKTRYVVNFADHTWEIDIFAGRNEGLEVAEIELSSEDEVFKIPKWIGAEVTDDHRYFNACLIDAPFDTWE